LRRTAIVLALVILAVVIAAVAAVLSLRTRLISHPREVPYWGYASAGVYGVASLTSYVGTRLITRRGTL